MYLLESWAHVSKGNFHFYALMNNKDWFDLIWKLVTFCAHRVRFSLVPLAVRRKCETNCLLHGGTPPNNPSFHLTGFLEVVCCRLKTSAMLYKLLNFWAWVYLLLDSQLGQSCSPVSYYRHTLEPCAEGSTCDRTRSSDDKVCGGYPSLSPSWI